MLLVFIVVVILGHNLDNSQVSVYRTIGPTLVFLLCNQSSKKKTGTIQGGLSPCDF